MTKIIASGWENQQTLFEKVRFLPAFLTKLIDPTMHEDFDEEYDEDDFNYDHPSLNHYQWYYKFDIGPDTPLSKWINDLFNEFNAGLNNIPGFTSKKFPVNSWNPNAGGNSFQYLGSNYQGDTIWKKQYFVIDQINIYYKLHLQSYAAYFVSQPKYYKGLFDILN